LGGRLRGGDVVASIGLAARLQERTAKLHRQAERSGFVRTMLQGRASRAGYALFLLNLLPAYRALESGLERERQDPRLTALALPALYRTSAIENDLTALLGAGEAWPEVLPTGAAYGALVARATGARLIGHAYVRYLGDLSGGQILARLLARSPGLGSEALAFYDFPAIADTALFRDAYRAAIDAAELSDEDEVAVLDEACTAFEQNVRLSEELAATSPG
jgi:heme oxygenase